MMEVHQKLSCGLGAQAYANAIHVAGFCATSLITYIKDYIGACEGCTQVKMLLKGKSSIAQSLKSLSGPDDLLGQAASKNPVGILVADECGPFYVQDGSGTYKSTHILACVELLTYKVYLIPLPKIDTIHFVKALEILQSMRGKITTLILDDHAAHGPLDPSHENTSKAKQSILAGVFKRNHASVLANAGIQIVIASSNRHEKVGRAEFVVKKVKFFLASALKCWAFHDDYDFYHKISLIALYLNERPVFHTPQGILTPYSLEQAMLERAQGKPKFFTLAEYLIPSDKQMYNQILKMAEFSKQILFEIASSAATQLLNKKVLNIKFKEGDLVYVPDKVIKKHPHSLRDALGKIKKVQESGRDYIIQMIDGGELKRHFSDIVSASATANQSEVTLIDPFQLVDPKTRIIPHHMYPQFKLILDKFNNTDQSHNTDHNREFEDLPPLEEMDTTTYSQQEYEQEQGNTMTGDQVLEHARITVHPTPTEEMLRNMLQNNPPEEIVIPADLRHIPKPKSFNKRKNKNDKKKGAPEYHAPQRIQREVSPNAESDENRYLAPIRIQPEMEISERQEQEVDDSTDDPDYRTFLNPQSTSNDGNNQPRRSSRVPLLSAKALENLVDKNQ